MALRRFAATPLCGAIRAVITIFRMPRTSEATIGGKINPPIAGCCSLRACCRGVDSAAMNQRDAI